jgi:hypothetical protein
MTASGFSATSKEPFFGWIARVELGYPDHEQHKKSLAVLQLLADESATEA